jgi:hypothetical protein
MSFGHLLAVALILMAPSASFAFGLMTSKESVRATAATDGLLYCLSKGHEVFRVEAPPGSACGSARFGRKAGSC